MKFSYLYPLFLCGVAAFNSPSASNQHVTGNKIAEESRSEFMSKIGLIAGASVLANFPMPAEARGRATLEGSYERYTPRIVTGGQFFATDLRKLIEKNDWAGLKAATSDPPKKSKADRAKIDGGIAERASQAGGFSDARVLVAADLLAGSFSDNSITSKTKKMQEQVVALREVVSGINQAALVALGEESAGGGVFGFGGKKPSQAELAQTIRALYAKGGTAYNQYIFDANDELPLSLKKLPYLK
mmetsp:Transcript_11411/g.18938  ORF Transcript_11411/g.18938 Transcript_11411/m.18938 type:complete len:244 (-) Transcript_11411:61-792(-)